MDPSTELSIVWSLVSPSLRSKERRPEVQGRCVEMQAHASSRSSERVEILNYNLECLCSVVEFVVEFLAQKGCF